MLVLGVALFVMAVVLPVSQETLLSVPSWLVSIAGVVGAAIALYHSRRSGRRTADSLEFATEQLARAERERWTTETALRRLRDPSMMPLSWRRAESSISDRLVGISPLDSRGKLASDGRADELARLFSRIPSRRLLILGAPGSGKTTLAMTLVLQLLERRTADDPVPVLLPLAAWDPSRQPYRRWLVDRLTMSYPAMAVTLDTGRTAAEELVRAGLLVPVLDGLDELSQERRGMLVAQLNAALTSADPLVLTSRTNEYRELVESSGAVLSLAAVVEIQPLAHEDVVRYLLSNQVTARRGSIFSDVLEAAGRHPEGPLWQVISSPLMLNLFRDAYTEPGSDPTELLDSAQFTESREITEHLIGRYVRSAVSVRADRRAHWEPAVAERWLSFLARHMSRAGGFELIWWELDRSMPRKIPAIAGAWLVGGVTGVAVTLRYGALPGLVAAFLTAIVAGLLSVLIVRRGQAAPRVISFPVDRSGLASRAFIIGVLAATPLALLTAYIAGWTAGAGAGLGLAAALTTMAWLATPDRPAQAGMTATLQATRLFALVTWVAVALSVAVLWSLLAYRLHLDELTLGIVAAAATVPWLTAGSAWGRFTIARTWFALRGQMPWRLLSFLDDMYRAGLLRRSGQSYEFRHASLAEVFRR